MALNCCTHGLVRVVRRALIDSRVRREGHPQLALPISTMPTGVSKASADGGATVCPQSSTRARKQMRAAEPRVLGQAQRNQKYSAKANRPMRHRLAMVRLACVLPWRGWAQMVLLYGEVQDRARGDNFGPRPAKANSLCELAQSGKRAFIWLVALHHQCVRSLGQIGPCCVFRSAFH